LYIWTTQLATFCYALSFQIESSSERVALRQINLNCLALIHNLCLGSNYLTSNERRATIYTTQGERFQCRSDSCRDSVPPPEIVIESLFPALSRVNVSSFAKARESYLHYLEHVAIHCSDGSCVDFRFKFQRSLAFLTTVVANWSTWLLP
jgi:hypothetical protein